MAEAAKSSPEYAMLPAGTVVKFGAVGDDVATMKPLVNCKALGATGLTGSFIDCTTLIDTAKQFISDLPEGPEKSLGFIDDPENEDFTAFLNAAEARETVQFYVELPNKRTATMVLALSGWQMNEITAPASEVIQITVSGKQNNLVWGVKKSEPVAVESVTVSDSTGKTTGLTVTVGDEDGLQLKAVVAPTGADYDGVTWELTPGTGTGAVSAAGLVTGATAGEVTVTATAGGVTSDPVTVTVEEAE